MSEALGVEGTDSPLTKPVSRVRGPWPEPFMPSFFDEPFPIRNMDFQFGAPGDEGEVGPLGGDRVLSGEAVRPFLSDAVAGMFGSGKILVAGGESVGDVNDGEGENYGRRSLSRARDRAALTSVTLHLLPPRSNPSLWSPIYQKRSPADQFGCTLTEHPLPLFCSLFFREHFSR